MVSLVINLKKRIRLSDACYDTFVRAKRAIVTRYNILITIGSIAREGSYHGALIYAFTAHPTSTDFSRVLNQLTEEYKIAADPDFSRGVFTVNRLADVSADEACCLIDPYCYVSHLSAMQNYGLTDRIPDALTLTRPIEAIWRKLAERDVAATRSELGGALSNFPRARPHRHEIPDVVRHRPINIHTTKSPGQSVQVRDGFARIARIEQVFCDMLMEPGLCGGIRHVLEVWRDQAPQYLHRIVAAVDRLESSIAKVRAGYILAEFMGLENPTVEGWRRFAQRGGSRLLDPSGDYAPVYSEEWMISLNTDLPSRAS